MPGPRVHVVYSGLQWTHVSPPWIHCQVATVDLWWVLCGRMTHTSSPYTHVSPRRSTCDLNRPYLVRDPGNRQSGWTKVAQKVELGGVAAISTLNSWVERFAVRLTSSSTRLTVNPRWTQVCLPGSTVDSPYVDPWHGGPTCPLWIHGETTVDLWTWLLQEELNTRHYSCMNDDCAMANTAGGRTSVTPFK